MIHYHLRSRITNVYELICKVAMLGNLVMNPSSKENLILMEKLCHAITCDVGIVFGNQLSYVRHRVFHFPHFIRLHGPLFLVTAFPIEKLISIINHCITGNIYIEKRLCIYLQ